MTSSSLHKTSVKCVHACRWGPRELSKDAKSTWQLAAIRLQPLLTAKPGGNLGCENTKYWPQLAEVHIKRMISINPDLCFFPQKSAKFLKISGFLLLAVIFCSHYLFFVTKLLYMLTNPSPPWRGFLRVTWDAASQAQVLILSPIKVNSQLLVYVFFKVISSKT